MSHRDDHNGERRLSIGCRYGDNRPASVRAAGPAGGGGASLAGSMRTAVETLRPALELWRGDALADVRHLEGVLVEVTRLDEMRLQALGTLIDAELGLGTATSR